MSRLGLSRRQFYRELNKAITALAGTLLEKLPDRPAEGTPASEQTLEAEARRLGSRAELLDIAAVLEEIISFAEPLAQERSVGLFVQSDERLPPVQANRILLRQALLKSLSALLTCAGTQRVSARARTVGDAVRIELAAYPAAGRERGIGVAIEEATTRLIQLAGGAWGGVERTDDGLILRCEFPASGEKTVLVVDDHELIITIFRRYLSSYRCRVLGATTATEALRLAREAMPTAITLDVMMPAQDGWEVLRTLKSDPITRHIPVVVCSVLEDPALATSLGAAAYLRKPVTQADLLASIARLIEAPGE